MKTILIEQVTNGWIVRPFSPCEAWATSDRAGMAVYRSLTELQSDLPRLLFEPRTPAQRHPSGEHPLTPATDGWPRDKDGHPCLPDPTPK